MADADAADAAGADALTRLEAALERIALSTRPTAAASADTSAVAERLDALIAQMRGALAEEV